jgi:EmrB/QacA subfamily drug resistance transporter
MAASSSSSPAGRALFVAIAGSSMASLDATVVNVALPVIQRQLGASLGAVQWMVEAYALLLASLVLVGGALGDRFGRKRIFLGGVVLFALSSAACGAAPGAWLLVAARAVQGVGAALLVPGSLALIGSAYEGPARDKAIGIWSASGAITGALGPVLGGWVVVHASWRWLFLFNVPLALLVIAVARTGVAETRDPDAAPRTDVAGASLVTVGLGLLVFALIDHGAHTGSAGTLLLYIGGTLALVSFVVLEARVRAPMVDLSLFRRPTFAGTNLLTLLLYGALGGAFFFLPFELIQIRGYSPTQAGATLLPCIVCIAALSPFAGSLASAHGPRVLLTVGPLVAGAGFFLLALLPRDDGGSYWTSYFPGVVVLGLGMGLTVAPLTAAVMGSVEARHAGVASGVNNAVARAASLLAVAAFGVLLRTRFDAVFDAGVAASRLDPTLADRIASERGKLGGADFSGLDPAVAAELRGVVAHAYFAAVHGVMMASAILAAVSAAGAVLFLRSGLRRGLTPGTPPSSSTEVTDNG